MKKQLLFILSTICVLCMLFPTMVLASENVAKVGDVGYPTLKAAFDAAETGATIVLQENASGEGIVINKNITIDFGGYTYSFTQPAVGSTGTESNGFQILKGNTVTLRNGTLNVDADYADKYYILVQNYANLTVEDMTLDGTNLDKYSGTDGDSYTTLSINCGTIEITGETDIIANDEGDLAVAFDVCKYADYALPKVEVTTTGTVTGKIEVTEESQTAGVELRFFVQILLLAGLGIFNTNTYQNFTLIFELEEFSFYRVYYYKKIYKVN